MKIAAHIAGALLGLLFIATASMFLLNKMPDQPPPKEQAAVQFMSALISTGYMHFVKVIELLGGIFVLIPKTRNLGLLLLGPIIVNILAFHQFVAKDGLLNPMLIAIIVLPLFLLWTERARWKALIS